MKLKIETPLGNIELIETDSYKSNALITSYCRCPYCGTDTGYKESDLTFKSLDDACKQFKILNCELCGFDFRGKLVMGFITEKI